MGAGLLGDRLIKIVILKVEAGVNDKNHGSTERGAGCMQISLIKKPRCSVDENVASLTEIEYGFVQRMNSYLTCVILMKMN